MTREMTARDVNFIADYATRSIGVDRVEYKEGQIIILNRSESWDYDGSEGFYIEDDNYKYEVVFNCANLLCHKVDYSNEEEVELLNAVEGEGEVLVPTGTKFKVVSVATESDFEEMGYFEVELEIIK